MAITTYEFYINTFYGDVISERDFPKWASKAEDDLMYITNGRINEVEYVSYIIQIQKAVCALAELDFKFDEAMKSADGDSYGAIRSISSGGESVSFDAQANVITNALGDKNAQEKLKFDTVRPYLYNTGLLFQGL